MPRGWLGPYSLLPSLPSSRNHSPGRGEMFLCEGLVEYGLSCAAAAASWPQTAEMLPRRHDRCPSGLGDGLQEEDLLWAWGQEKIR